MKRATTVTRKVGNTILRYVPEGAAPPHFLWKRVLEREWAGEWGTLAKLTGYRYRMGIDPAFVEEPAQFQQGQLHWYEWILCGNGGFVSLYDDAARIGKLCTTTQTAEKVLGAGVGAKLFLSFDDRLSREVHFPLVRIVEVCELIGARRRHQGRMPSEAQREQFRQMTQDRRERQCPNKNVPKDRTPRGDIASKRA